MIEAVTLAGELIWELRNQTSACMVRHVLEDNLHHAVQSSYFIGIGPYYEINTIKLMALTWHKKEGKNIVDDTL